MIKFDNVCYSVKDGLNETKKILNNISFTLPNKGMVALIGPSGSGKTTILNLICKKIDKTSGSIIFENIDYDTASNKDIENIRTNHLSFISQDLELFNDLSVYDNILYAFKLKNMEIDLDLYNKYLSMLKLDNCKNEITRNLSRGEKQRVAILRGILTNPKILILDEPTSSLDKTNSLILMNFLNEISKEILVLFTTHDLNIIHEYNIDIIEIEYGSIISNTLTQKQMDNEYVLKTNTLKKNSFKNINYIRKKIFHKQNFKSIFSMILLSISLILLVIPFAIFTYNKYDFSYNVYKKPIMIHL